MTVPAYSTSQLARAGRIHPNTVRLYEQWGYLAPAKRKPNGYRVFGKRHLEQLKLVRLAFPGPHPGGGRAIRAMVLAYARGRVAEAKTQAALFRANVQREKAAAEEAIRVVERWLGGKPVRSSGLGLSRKAAAKSLGISLDALRNWERNGLLFPPVGEGGRRSFGERELERAKVIRVLRAAGYNLLPIRRMFEKVFRNLDAGVRESLENFDDEIGCITNKWMTLIEANLKRAEELAAYLSTKHPPAP